MKRLQIVIAGGSGQLGRILARYLYEQGHFVTVMGRHAAAGPWRTVIWNGQRSGAWTGEFEMIDVLINLSGRSVNCRYTERNRAEIKTSRIETTRVLGQAISELTHPPALWLNASTATIYRHSFDRDMDERTGELGGGEVGVPATWDFSVDVACSWEKEFFDAPTPHTRKVALRTAMVMSPDRGGVFDVLLKLVRFGLGGQAASGDQYVSWIHHTDFTAAVDFLISHPEIMGPVNIASPYPLPNKAFMQILRDAWGTRVGVMATPWMLEAGAFLLQTETELLLKSRRVVPGLLLNAGFLFQFPQWQEAAEDLVCKWRAMHRPKTVN